MAGDYHFYNAALKLQLNDYLSFGLIYDQPFGADAEYKDTTLFTHPSQGTTKAEVDTQNISMIFGIQPIKNVNLYAGGVYQTVKGDVQLRGAAYSIFGGYAPAGLIPGTTQSTAVPATIIPGYNANIPEDSAAGWLAGAAYQIPEIALKASVTYRSEVKHKVNIAETIYGVPAALNGSTDITTPQSVNLDLQSGIMADTVAFANIRWVNWKDFAIRPYKFGILSQSAAVVAQTGKTNGFDLVAYTDDQYSVNAGIGRKLNDQWAGNVSVGWDSGAGNPVTTLGPTEGYWNVGVGMQFSPTPTTFIAGGVKYFWLGDAQAQPGSAFGTSNYVAEFSDNHALAYGMKIGYRF
jgi:long-chain fatty acid transport protein